MRGDRLHGGKLQSDSDRLAAAVCRQAYLWAVKLSLQFQAFHHTLRKALVKLHKHTHTATHTHT